MAGDIGSQGYRDRVFFDSINGVAGIEWPVGTPQLPSDVIADVITMLAARNLHTIEVHGTLSLTATMNHYCFFGHEHEAAGDILNLGGQDVDDSYFEGLIITGIQGGAGLATYRNCLFVSTIPIPMSGFRGMAKGCAFFGGLGITLATGNADYADFDHCTSVHGVASVIIGSPDRVSFKDFSGGLILSVQAAGDVFVRGISGYLEIDEMTGGTLEIYAHGADIVINADCTGGTIAIFGDARVTDNSAGGCVVTDSTKETQLDTIQAAVAAMAGGTFFGSYGPRNVEVDNDVDFGIMLYDPSGNIITTGEITQGTYTVRRVRGAVDTEIVAAVASSEAAGRVYMTYAFPGASWNVGDIFYITFIGIVVTLAGVVTEYPNLFIWGRVVREPDLSSKIDVIDADVDPRVMGRAQIKATTEDLQQAAASYDLVTGTTQDVIIESLTLRCPVDCSDDVGAFTGISIQTDDTTPQELISVANGAMANLTAQAQLSWTGAILLKATKKIQLTIIGGPADDPTVCDIVVKCRAVVSGGYLA